MNQKKVWDNIAESWSNFRQKPEKRAEELADRWKPGIVLDVGCGNCRNLLPFYNKKFKCYGVDFSNNMLKQAKLYMSKNNFKVVLKLGNATKLPHNNNSFDYVICFLMLHHLENHERGIKEIYRVLKNKGQAYISVWNKLQPKFLLRGKETYVGWGKEKRYYHFISFLEMRKLLKKYNFNILESRLLGKNLEFLVEKN